MDERFKWMCAAFLIGVLVSAFIGGVLLRHAHARSAERDRRANERIDRIALELADADRRIEDATQSITDGIDDAEGTASDIDATIARLGSILDAAIRAVSAAGEAIENIERILREGDSPGTS